ncbi:MAG TPA: hypothetical protein VEC37_12990, partial [Bacillota bacterium]|nr:hypothetical protein [Bacillota bacterium]
LKYNISQIFGVNLGYSYNYGKSEDCIRMMDSGNGYEKLDQLVDLELAQHGYYLGISARF